MKKKVYKYYLLNKSEGFYYWYVRLLKAKWQGKILFWYMPDFDNWYYVKILILDI